MDHLTVDEMMDFVSIDQLDQASLALASKVHAHLLQCEACREKVAAYQAAYDGLVKIANECKEPPRGKDDRDGGITAADMEM